MNYEKLPKTISAEELLSTPLPPVKWIIPDLLPAGLALFAGPSKAGKSWLTLWLCLQIAQGNPVWNREIEPRTVIYFSLEDTFNRLQNRIFQLIDGGDAPERLILQTECPSIGQGLEEQVESLIHTYCDVGLIVIDTLQKVRLSDGNGGMYANDYKEAGALKKLADKYGICILLIHHLRKQTASDPFDQISGSTGIMGVADTSWVMQRKRMSQTADILLTGRDMDDRTLHLREENCIWTLEDEETAEERKIRAVPDYLWKAAEYIENSQFLQTPMVMYRTRIPLPDICVSCISNADYLRITTCIPCGISTQRTCCRKAPANRWRHPCGVMRIRRSWSAPTAIRRTWRNSRPQS